MATLPVSLQPHVMVTGPIISIYQRGDHSKFLTTVTNELFQLDINRRLWSQKRRKKDFPHFMIKEWIRKCSVRQFIEFSFVLANGKKLPGC